MRAGEERGAHLHAYPKQAELVLKQRQLRPLLLGAALLAQPALHLTCRE